MNVGKEERAEREKLYKFGGKKIAHHCYLLVKTCANPLPCLLPIASLSLLQVLVIETENS